MVTPAGRDATHLSARERETRLIVYDNQQFDQHDPGWGHPECQERLEAIRTALAPYRWPVRPGRYATRQELERVHTDAYIDLIMSVQGQSAQVDPDTGTSPGSVDAALIAVGSAVEAAELTAAGRNCFVTCRPPGHHATPARGMGFCLFNNAAAAAAHLAWMGYRVAIIDPDVHHGNGTQDIFYDSAQVLYVSTHRWPFYPGSGGVDEIGSGAGRGATFNVPLPAGADDGLYLSALGRLILPALQRFAPQVCIISAGFDAMEGDLLGGMNLTREGLAVIGHAIASRWPTMAVLEGGYNTQRLGGDAAVLANALAGAPAPDVAVRLSPAWDQRLLSWSHPLLGT